MPQHNTGLRLYLLCISLYLPTFCLAMDKTMLAPALGYITKEFGTVKDVGWYTSAGLLGTAVVQPLCGAVYKFFDSKWVYAVSLILFEIGSLVAAMAPTSAALIVGRAICGFGGAGVATGNFVILAKSVPLSKIPKYMGFSGAIWAAATVAGPLLGGFFAEKLSWRWCFYINLPVGAVALILLIIVFPSGSFQAVNESFLSRILHLDIAGFAAFIPTIVMLLLAFQWGGSEYSWSSPVIIGL
jgi:MFS family permease